MNFSPEGEVDSDCGISVLANQDLSRVFDGLTRDDYLLLQVMTMTESPHCNDLITKLVEDGVIVYINYDAQASILNHESAPFGLGSVPVNFRQTRPASNNMFIPVDKNHIRLCITRHMCVFSTMDISEGHNHRRNREPLYLIGDPEIVEQLKALFLQAPIVQNRYGYIDFITRLDNRLVMDCGQDKSNMVLALANDFLVRNSIPGTEIEIVSSWFPDACYISIINAAKNGAKIKITILDPLCAGGKGGLSEVPFCLTKVLSNRLSGLLPPSVEIRYVHNLHGKYMTAKRPDSSVASVITTSNLTRWGVLARSEEMAIMTKSQQVYDQLIDFSFNL